MAIFIVPKQLLFSETAGCFLSIKAVNSLQFLINIKCRKVATAVIKTLVGIYTSSLMLTLATQSSFETYN